MKFKNTIEIDYNLDPETTSEHDMLVQFMSEDWRQTWFMLATDHSNTLKLSERKRILETITLWYTLCAEEMQGHVDRLKT